MQHASADPRDVASRGASEWLPIPGPPHICEGRGQMLTPSVQRQYPSAKRSARTPIHVVDEIGVLPPVLADLFAATSATDKETSWGAFVERYTPLLLHTAYRL